MNVTPSSSVTTKNVIIAFVLPLRMACIPKPMVKLLVRRIKVSNKTGVIQMSAPVGPFPVRSTKTK